MSGKKRILVAMSGGVDSTTTAALLKAQGHEVIGVTMQLWDYGESDNGCCTLDDVRDARRDAKRLGIPHYVVNYMDLFKKYIVEDFIDKYFSGKTPNPCVVCNQTVKFNFLLKRSMELEADYLATGHYARIERDSDTGVYYLKKGLDTSKDQSYFLFGLTQGELSRLMFPLGELDKNEVRELAKEFKLDVAEKAESQDICFLSGGDYRDFLEQHGVAGKPSGSSSGSFRGEIVDIEGRVLATHEGIQNFTVGQRRGLGLPGGNGGGGEKLYVINVDPATNKVYVGTKEYLMKNTLTASNVIWTAGIPDDCIQSGLRTKAKIRYRHIESDVSVSLSGTDEVGVKFDKPQRAMTPGQAVVFYEDSRVLGGGWIKEVH